MTRDEALKKVKKCLALSRSAGEHEAAAALRQAQKLMAQFDLGAKDIDLADVSEVEAKACSMAANEWEARLASMIAQAFGCEHFTSLVGRYTDSGAYVRTRFYVFVGLAAAPSVAGYAYQVLARQCAKARLAHIAMQSRNCKAITKTARGDAFAIGWVGAVQQLVDRIAQPAANRALLLAYMEGAHPDMGTVQPRNAAAGRKTDWGHFAAGHHAGKKAQLSRGVGGLAPQELLT